MKVDTRVLYLRVSSTKCFLLFFSGVPYRIYHSNGYKRISTEDGNATGAPVALIRLLLPPSPHPFLLHAPLPLKSDPFYPNTFCTW